MERRYLLHMLTATKNVSPFDVNMAYDAGWDAVASYTDLSVEEVAGLVQDAIFSRGPKGVRRTGIFLGGRDPFLAMDMLSKARKAMVPPFEVSVCADPSGAFTTGAALIACVEASLRSAHQVGLAGARVLVFGGTGPVGSTAAVLAAQEGASVTIVGHEGEAGPRAVAETCRARYGVVIGAADGSSDARKADLISEADVVLATARAGVQVLSKHVLASARRLKVAADINAVPPAGIEGIGVGDDGVALQDCPGALGLGALAVGNVKYHVQHTLLQTMREAEQARYLGFREAFEAAQAHVA